MFYNKNAAVPVGALAGKYSFIRKLINIPVFAVSWAFRPQHLLHTSVESSLLFSCVESQPRLLSQQYWCGFGSGILCGFLQKIQQPWCGFLKDQPSGPQCQKSVTYSEDRCLKSESGILCFSNRITQYGPLWWDLVSIWRRDLLIM